MTDTFNGNDPSSRKIPFDNRGWVDERLLTGIEYVKIERIKFYANNPRKHSKRQQGKIDKSLATFGFVLPALLDADGYIISGEALVRSAIRLGYSEVPVVWASHLDPAAIKALRIALNRLADLGEWDDEKLALEFQGLIDLDSDVELTGFDMGEVDLILDANLSIAPENPADALPSFDGPIVSRLGDVWNLDEHRVGCGDARDPDAYNAILRDDLAAMVMSDPPYNVKISGHVSGLGAVEHDEFVMASGEMTADEFRVFLDQTVRNLIRFTALGSLHFIFMDWRHLHQLQIVCEAHYDALVNICVWAKTNGGMGSMYRSQHEMVVVYKNGTVPHVNNVQLGRFGRNRTNVWCHEGCNSPSPDRRADLKLHPTVKPVALVADAIRDASRRGDIILDSFLGSGTTVIACEETGRVCRDLELDPKYVDVIVRRWQAFTGRQAVHAGTGLTFDEMVKIRNAGQLLLPAPVNAVED